ncbi:MAG: dephospho-CoA kinase [bacterium]
MVIGLTGSIASGKTLTSNYLKSLNYKVIDCDEISHQIILKPNDCYYKLIEEFGDILDGEEISRDKLRNIVFNNKELLNKLNSILHPAIYQEVKKQITNELVFIDCPLLFETNFKELCDQTLVISTKENIQIDRLIKRNNITKEEAKKRIQLQMSLKDKEKQATYIINNINDEQHLYKQIDDLLIKLKEN